NGGDSTPSLGRSPSDHPCGPMSSLAHLAGATKFARIALRRDPPTSPREVDWADLQLEAVRCRSSGPVQDESCQSLLPSNSRPSRRRCNTWPPCYAPTSWRWAPRRGLSTERRTAPYWEPRRQSSSQVRQRRPSSY